MSLDLPAGQRSAGWPVAKLSRVAESGHGQVDAASLVFRYAKHGCSRRVSVRRAARVHRTSYLDVREAREPPAAPCAASGPMH